LRLQEEARRGDLASRDVQDHTAKMKTEISDLRQKSNSHAMEKLELQRTELVQMKQVCGSVTMRESRERASGLSPLDPASVAREVHCKRAALPLASVRPSEPGPVQNEGQTESSRSAV